MAEISVGLTFAGLVLFCLTILSDSVLHTTELECNQPHFRVRDEKTGCDNNTCATALSIRRIFAQFIQKITWCDCMPNYYRDSKGDCVTREQCQKEKDVQTTLPCNPGNLKCLKPHEEIKCFHEIAACANTSCVTAYLPRVVCNFLLPPQIDIHCGCKYGYFKNSAGNCVTKEQCLTGWKSASNS